MSSKNSKNSNEQNPATTPVVEDGRGADGDIMNGEDSADPRNPDQIAATDDLIYINSMLTDLVMLQKSERWNDLTLDQKALVSRQIKAAEELAASLTERIDAF